VFDPDEQADYWASYQLALGREIEDGDEDGDDEDW
jgi:hypothetical protein